MPSTNDAISADELIKITDFESREPAYTRWKREKIEAALRHADSRPDDFLTENEIWTRHGIEH